MATKKDLVEAYSFSRRRLVTAFVSGAPGGREVEPPRPGRTVVGGLALAVLLVAGTGVAHLLSPATAADWTQPGLVSEKETGADYVILEEPAEGEPAELRPVANITSAMLLLGADVEPTVVPAEEIDGEVRGDRIGILQAPATPPSPDLLVPTGWTSCTGTAADGSPLGIRTRVADDPQVAAVPDRGVVVRSDDRTWLLAETDGVTADDPRTARAYPVPEDAQTSLLSQLVGATDPVAVPPDWLALFPTGGALRLDTLGVSEDEIGSRPAAAALRDAGLRVGDVVGDGAGYVVRADDVLELDDFSRQVYDLVAPEHDERPDTAVPDVDAVAVAATDPDVAWPTGPVSALDDPQVCALLDTAPDRAPATLLALPDGPESSAEEVPEGVTDPMVETGHGAVVDSGDFSGEGAATPTLVDDRARAYGLDEQSRDLLGYADVPRVVVPQPWLLLLPSDVALTQDAARCPPDVRSSSC
ncbi:MAG: hypothetical protein CMH83_10920 [Nocardioides sp.]|nr:hypothetical protein [Nocardioides sp.]